MEMEHMEGGMEGMHGMGDMSAMMGPVVFESGIFGTVHLGALLMIVSGIFYLICALAILKPYREEKNELLGALLAFLSYQTISMIFMGLEMHTMNLMYSNIAGLAIFLGSAYMLKFPISSLPEKARRGTFLVVLVIVLGLFAWFMSSAERQMDLMTFVLWYDILVNGIIVGGSIILFGVKAVERRTKLKALGGGTGVLSCCVASNAAMLGGALFASAFFQFLAPILILGTISRSRKLNSAPSTNNFSSSPTV